MHQIQLDATLFELLRPGGGQGGNEHAPAVQLVASAVESWVRTGVS